jgi:hypothetical protein
MNLIGRFYIKKGLLYLMLLFLYGSSAGKEKHLNSNGEEPAVHIITAAKYDRDSSSGVIPFTRAGNLIVVKAKVDTMEGNFILDTGSPHLVLNLTYFRDYPSTWSQSE